MTRIPHPDTALELNLAADNGVPTAFTWNAHRYVVSRVLMKWVEGGPWWKGVRSLAALVEADDLDATWNIWRVEARSVVGVLVCDLAQRDCLTSASSYPWRMLRVID